MSNRNRTLTARAKGDLRLASQQAVQETFDGLAYYIKREKLIGVRNRYRDKCAGRIRRDTNRPTFKPKDMAQYIAASAPVHCMDGWSFLGRAITSYVLGDVGTACHLAYYAELRGALALLAREGIGIFLNQHYVVDKPNHAVEVHDGRNTHTMAWLTLNHWAELERSVRSTMEVIAPGGTTLSEWMEGFMTGTSVTIIGRRWLRAWGLDLQRLSKDHVIRNEVSYRPSFFNYTNRLGPESMCQFLTSFWSLCEPSDPSRFDRLDRYLLRNGLELAYFADTDKAPSASDDIFRERVRRMISKVDPPGLSPANWERFLLREIQASDPMLIAEATGSDPVNSPKNPLQLMSRAALLLRLATGVCSLLLRRSGVGYGNLAFWWDSVGVDFGLWPPHMRPNEVTDLWAEVETSLNDIADWQESNDVDSASLSKLLQTQAFALTVLGECERIGLWGLAS